MNSSLEEDPDGKWRLYLRQMYQWQQRVQDQAQGLSQQRHTTATADPPLVWTEDENQVWPFGPVGTKTCSQWGKRIFKVQRQQRQARAKAAQQKRETRRQQKHAQREDLAQAASAPRGHLRDTLRGKQQDAAEYINPQPGVHLHFKGAPLNATASVETVSESLAPPSAEQKPAVGISSPALLPERKGGRPPKKKGQTKRSNGTLPAAIHDPRKLQLAATSSAASLQSLGGLSHVTSSTAEDADLYSNIDPELLQSQALVPYQTAPEAKTDVSFDASQSAPQPRTRVPGQRKQRANRLIPEPVAQSRLGRNERTRYSLNSLNSHLNDEERMKAEGIDLTWEAANPPVSMPPPPKGRRIRRRRAPLPQTHALVVFQPRRTTRSTSRQNKRRRTTPTPMVSLMASPVWTQFNRSAQPFFLHSSKSSCRLWLN